MKTSESKTTGVTNGKTIPFLDNDSLGFLNDMSDDLIMSSYNSLEVFRADDKKICGLQGFVKTREADIIKHDSVDIIKHDFADFDGGPTVEVRPISRGNHHALDGIPYCSFKPIERAELILRHYDPVNYRGLICPLSGHPYTLDTIQCKREGNLVVDRDNGTTTYKSSSTSKRATRPFNQTAAVFNHVTDGANLGIYLSQKECRFIAFDLDSHAIESDITVERDESLRYSVAYLISVLYRLGLKPFLYFSGKKGFHVEAFFDKPVPVGKLKSLNNIVLVKHAEKGGAPIDVTYPCNSAYRVFGCFHFKTGYFTQAQEIEIYDNYTKVGWDCLNYDDSWEAFANVPLNSSDIVDKIIAAHPDIKLPPKPTKREQQHQVNYAPKGVYYNSAILKKIHDKGLYGEYHRYNSAFNLGRYFRYFLGLSEVQVITEITTWLKRHFPEKCHNNGLIPFEGAHNRIKSRFEDCIEETIQNCLNGFLKGKPFKPEKVEIFGYDAVTYIRDLQYNRKQQTALWGLLNYAKKHNSLNLYVSYNNLHKIFNVISRSTVSKWLKIFKEDNILIPLNDHIRKQRGQMQYRLMLPESCYRVIPDQEG